jgi:NitT/TauT family transport system permease protein
MPAWVLSWFLFAAGIIAYFYAAQARHRENPDDRVMPTVSQMVKAFEDAATNPPGDQDDVDAPKSWMERVRASMLATDTLATARRFAISVALLFPAVLLGLHMAMFPYVGVFFLRFFQFFDKIVALSLLPILFIAFGIDELSKIALILIASHPP